LSDSFPIKNGLKQVYALSPLLFKFRIIMGKSKKNVPRHMWMDNIKMDLTEIGRGSVD
jgi:hypothetical protein